MTTRTTSGAALLAICALLAGACGGRAAGDLVEDTPAGGALCSGTVNKLVLGGRQLSLTHVDTSYADISTPPALPGRPAPPGAQHGTVVMRVSLDAAPVAPARASGLRAELTLLAQTVRDTPSWWTPAGLDLSRRDENQSATLVLGGPSDPGGSGSAARKFTTDSGLQLEGTVRAHRHAPGGPERVSLSLCLSCAQAPILERLQLYVPPRAP